MNLRLMFVLPDEPAPQEDYGMSKENGGPVHPTMTKSEEPGSYYLYQSEGMSLRDHFAGLAMQGLTSNMEWLRNIKASGENVAEACASASYQVADAMLAERAK